MSLQTNTRTGTIHLMMAWWKHQTACGIKTSVGDYDRPLTLRLKAGWEPWRAGDARLATCRRCHEVCQPKPGQVVVPPMLPLPGQEPGVPE